MPAQLRTAHFVSDWCEPGHVGSTDQSVTLLCKQRTVPKAHVNDVSKSSLLQTTNIPHKEVNLPLQQKQDIESQLGWFYFNECRQFIELNNLRGNRLKYGGTYEVVTCSHISMSDSFSMLPTSFQMQ